jgi:hypothetical protein
MVDEKHYEFLEKLLEKGVSIETLLRTGVAKAEDFTRLLRIECWGVDIEPSESLSMPWNGWEVYPSGYASFRSGAMMDAWIHLKKCEKCRQINGVSKRIAEIAVEALAKEWRDAVGYR